MYYEEESRILITASKDKSVKVFIRSINNISNLDMETPWKMDFWRCSKIWGNWNKDSKRYSSNVKNSKTINQKRRGWRFRRWP